MKLLAALLALTSALPAAEPSLVDGVSPQRQASAARPNLGLGVASGAEKGVGRAVDSGLITYPEKPQELVRLWPGDAPNLRPGGIPEVTDERGFIKHISVPELWVYLPRKTPPIGTAVIICPGGAYAGVAMRLHVEAAVRMFHEQGIAVFGLKYRTYYGKNDPQVDALADAKRAVQLVRSRAREWGVDPRRIGVQGYSAGSHVGLELCSRFDQGQPDATDPMERLSNRPDFVVLMCPWPHRQHTAESFPFSHNTPPMFLACARDDKECFDLAAAVDERLKTLGIERQFFVVETGGHGAFDLGSSKGPGAEWPTQVNPWLKKIGVLQP